MKDKILLFVIGTLVGAILATGAFFIYTKTSTSKNSDFRDRSMQMPGGEFSMQEAPQGENGQPPAKPGESTENNQRDNSQNNQQDGQGNSKTTNNK